MAKLWGCRYWNANKSNNQISPRLMTALELVNKINLSHIKVSQKPWCYLVISCHSRPLFTSLRASSPIWVSKASRTRASEQAAKPRGAEESLSLLHAPLSCLPLRASRTSTFHDIPQMESLLTGYFFTCVLWRKKSTQRRFPFLLSEVAGYCAV